MKNSENCHQLFPYYCLTKTSWFIDFQCPFKLILVLINLTINNNRTNFSIFPTSETQKKESKSMYNFKNINDGITSIPKCL